MGSILKNRKKIIITTASVLLTLFIVALAVIIGATPLDSHGADTYAGEAGVYGASDSNSTYSKLIKTIDSATTYAQLNTAITASVAKSLTCDGVKYAMKHLADRKSSGKVTDMTDSQYTTLYNRLNDNYQEKYWIDDKNGNGKIESGEYGGRYLSGTYNLPFDRSISDRNGNGWVWGVADGGCTFTGEGSSVLRIRSDYVTFHGKITIDGGHTLTITLDNSALETYIAEGKASNANFTLGTLIKREVEGALRVTSNGANKGLVPANATNNIVTQYSGPLFHIKNGTLIIKGTSGRAVTISGSGNFNFDYTDVSDGNAGLEFPPSINLGSNDDVVASGPMVLADGGAKAAKIQFDYVNMYSNYNASTEGGCFRIAACTPNVSLTNCKFERFYSSKSGSFMDLGTENGGGVTMTNCNVYNCYAAGKDNSTQGGTLRTYGMNNAFLKMTGCRFYQNWNKYQGTIIWSSLLANQTVDGQSTGCYIKDCHFYNNVSVNGCSGVYNAGRMIILTSEIHDNTTVYGGGAGVACATWASSTAVDDFSIQHDGNLTLGTGVKIYQNKALRSSGGGILVTCGVIGVNTGGNAPEYFPKKGDGSSYEMRVIVDGAEIYYNEAIYGGGIAISKTDYRGTASGHRADQDNSDYVVRFEMKSGSVNNNIAKQGVNKEGNTLSGVGGAVYLNDKNGTGNTVDFIMTGGRMVNNKATTEYSDGAGSRGGAVYVEGGGSFYMSGGFMSNNTSYHIGGAVCVYGGNVTISDQANLNENRAYRSGGVAYVSGGKLTISGGNMKDNRACKTDDTNNANDTGGAFFITNGGSVEMTGGLVNGNLAGGSGGAVFIDSGGTMLLKGGTISNNTTKRSGGVTKILDGTFHMTGGTVSGNIAADSGGVAFMQGRNSRVTIEGGTITGNRANTYYGGAIYLAGGTVNIMGGNITDNYAKQAGGAILAEAHTDGGVTYAPTFSMTGGTLTGNTTDGQGGAIYVADSASFEIGYEGCFGNGVKDAGGKVLHSTQAAPLIQNNTAKEGGGIFVTGGNPVVHCGKFYDNHAVAAGGSGGNGGGIFVNNAGITVNYADILENDATNKGGGIYVNSSSKSVSVLVDSGFVSYNTADVGAGIGVDVSGSYVATIVIGRQGCSGDPESEHKHPQISYNIATTKGGGLYFVSTSASGIDFKMYCGRLGNNAANANVPTGNVLQQGGTISIAGDYAIDNATVLNGTYQRPTISTDTITIVYHYNNADYTQGSSATSTVTVALGNDNRMFINLPTVDGKIADKMLVRWELKDSEGSVVKESRVVGDRLILNQNNYAAGSTLNFYGVWLAVGDAYLEPAYVTTGKVFSTIDSGLPYAYGKINNPFSVQFAVSRFNPYELGNRNLQFSEVAPAGTVIYMLYIKDGVTDYYHYNIVGDELRVDIDDFRRLGDPGAKWENTVNDTLKSSTESFTFIFDFARCETGEAGAIQITFERNYDEAKVGEVRAPLTQIITYTMDDAYLPRLTPSVTNTKSDTDVTISYDSGIASDNQSLYYGEETSLVIRDKDNLLDGEAYITLDGVKYYKNSAGIFIIPLGAANTSADHTLSLHSASLPYRADRAVTLSASLYITSDGERPLASPCMDSFDITFVADALPSASISLAERVFYTDSLPEGVQVLTTTANIDGCTLTYSIAKLEGGVYSTAAAEEDGVSISSTGLISLTNATYGTFRVTLTVSRGGIPTLEIPFNFIVLDR